MCELGFFLYLYTLYIQCNACLQTHSSLKFKCFHPFPSCLLYYTTFFCLSGIFTQRHTIAETSLRESKHCWSFVHNPQSVLLRCYSFLLYQHKYSKSKSQLDHSLYIITIIKSCFLYRYAVCHMFFASVVSEKQYCGM